MPEKELDYIRSTEAAGSTEKDGGVYIDAFDKQDSEPQKKGFAKFIDGFKKPMLKNWVLIQTYLKLKKSPS